MKRHALLIPVVVPLALLAQSGTAETLLDNRFMVVRRHAAPCGGERSGRCDRSL